MPATRFPDVQQVLVDSLVTLAGGDDHTGIETPVDLASRLPFVRVRRIGGGSDRLADYPRVEVDVFADGYEPTRQLAEDIRQWLMGPPPPVMQLDRVACDIGPRELPWGDGTVRRFGAEYSLVARRFAD